MQKDQGIATNLTKTSKKHSHGHRNLQKKFTGPELTGSGPRNRV